MSSKFINGLFWPPTFLVLGIGLTFYPWLSSGLTNTWLDLGDARLVHFILEHGYRYLSGYDLHKDFWNPPVFYPATNVSAYTDLMLGFGPFYWIWRIMEIDEWTAWQLWTLTIHVINFISFYCFLKSVTKSSALACSVAAYSVSFGILRHIGQPQMIALFYMILSLLAINKVVESNHRSLDKSRNLWICIFFISCCLQAFSAMYSLIFFSMYYLVGLLIIITSRKWRITLFEIISKSRSTIITCILLSCIVCTPLAYHYGMILLELGGRGFKPYSSLEFASLFSFRSGHWLYGATHNWSDFQHGVGFGTLIFVIVGCWHYWRSHHLYLLIIPALIVVLLGTRFGEISLWIIPYNVYPLSHAIRAVFRIALINIIPVSLGIAFAFRLLEFRRAYILISCAILVVVGEQYYPQGKGMNKDKRANHVKGLAERIHESCKSFYVIEDDYDYSSVEYPPYETSNEDAEWAAILSGIPTINGRYGNFPKDYHLIRKAKINMSKPYDTLEIRESLNKWMKINNHSIDSVCIIKYPRLVHSVE